MKPDERYQLYVKMHEEQRSLIKEKRDIKLTYNLM